MDKYGNLIFIKAHHSVPYAWDEPTLPPHITCNAPGGSSATYNMNVIGLAVITLSIC